MKYGRVVITGAKGGTGVSIVKEFRSAGYQVLGVDLKPPEWAEEDYRIIDLTDGAAVHDAFAGADAVVHFGSYPGDTYHAWDEVYRNIVIGGFHVFQACANLGIQRIAYASSPTVYGSPDVPPYLPADENWPLAPSSIYGAAKQNLETLARNYCRWNQDMAIAALRTCRIVYEQSFNWRFRHHTEDPRSAASALWSYSDARDVATACRAWIESDLTGFEAFDVAAEDVCMDIPTAELVEKQLPHDVEIRESPVGHRALISCRKLRSMLGWEPRYTWRDMEREAEGD